MPEPANIGPRTNFFDPKNAILRSHKTYMCHQPKGASLGDGFFTLTEFTPSGVNYFVQKGLLPKPILKPEDAYFEKGKKGVEFDLRFSDEEWVLLESGKTNPEIERKITLGMNYIIGLDDMSLTPNKKSQLLSSTKDILKKIVEENKVDKDEKKKNDMKELEKCLSTISDLAESDLSTTVIMKKLDEEHGKLEKIFSEINECEFLKRRKEFDPLSKEEEKKLKALEKKIGSSSVAIKDTYFLYQNARIELEKRVLGRLTIRKRAIFNLSPDGKEPFHYFDYMAKSTLKVKDEKLIKERTGKSPKEQYVSLLKNIFNNENIKVYLAGDIDFKAYEGDLAKEKEGYKTADKAYRAMYAAMRADFQCGIPGIEDLTSRNARPSHPQNIVFGKEIINDTDKRNKVDVAGFVHTASNSLAIESDHFSFDGSDRLSEWFSHEELHGLDKIGARYCDGNLPHMDKVPGIRPGKTLLEDYSYARRKLIEIAGGENGKLNRSARLKPDEREPNTGLKYYAFLAEKHTRPTKIVYSEFPAVVSESLAPGGEYIFFNEGKHKDAVKYKMLLFLSMSKYFAIDPTSYRMFDDRRAVLEKWTQYWKTH